MKKKKRGKVVTYKHFLVCQVKIYCTQKIYRTRERRETERQKSWNWSNQLGKANDEINWKRYMGKKKIALAGQLGNQLANSPEKEASM